MRMRKILSSQILSHPNAYQTRIQPTQNKHKPDMRIKNQDSLRQEFEYLFKRTSNLKILSQESIQSPRKEKINIKNPEKDMQMSVQKVEVKKQIPQLEKCKSQQKYEVKNLRNGMFLKGLECNQESKLRLQKKVMTAYQKLAQLDEALKICIEYKKATLNKVRSEKNIK